MAGTDMLHVEQFTVTTPAGPALVILSDRLQADPAGPRNGTVIVTGYKPERLTVTRPAVRASDDGGPVDQAWRAFNAAEKTEMRLVLDAVLPAILARCDGDPGGWTLSRLGMCTLCPCSPGWVADRRLTRDGRTADAWVSYPGGGGEL